VREIILGEEVHFETEPVETEPAIKRNNRWPVIFRHPFFLRKSRCRAHPGWLKVRPHVGAALAGTLCAISGRAACTP
jgi:hypothetical protein